VIAGIVLIIVGVGSILAAIIGKDFKMGERTIPAWCGRLFFAVIAGGFIGKGVALIIQAH
jgi:hypothetical protein